METEPLRGFPRRIQTVLRDGKTDYAIRLFNDDKYLEDIRDQSYDLIPVITVYLTEANRCNKPELYKCCKHLMMLVSEKSNPDEALLQILTEIQGATDNSTFVTLLDPLQKVICRISRKKVKSLAWSLEGVHNYLIVHCDLPDYENLEGKEKLLVDQGRQVGDITRLYTEVIIFYGKIISDFQGSLDSERKAVLRKFLVQLLGAPLCYLNMHSFDNIKTDAREIAENIMEKVFKFMDDPVKLAELRYDKLPDELITPDILSIANLFFLIYCEGVSLEVVPKVYSSTYILILSMPILCALLRPENNILIEKGLLFSQSILNQVKNEYLSYFILDCNNCKEFCLLLCNIIVYNSSEYLRKLSLTILTTFLNSFEVKGVYIIILNLMNTLNHSGLKGYLITFYKDLLSCNFGNNKTVSSYFRGSKLFRLLRKFCYLNEKEETNIVANSDQIVSSLNLLRYLSLRDKLNITEFWDIAPDLYNTYLEPLRKGIELSKAHYDLEIKNTNNKQHKKEKEGVEMSVSVCGEDLLRMEKHEKLHILNTSLTALDVIDSLLCRVTELLEIKRS